MFSKFFSRFTSTKTTEPNMHNIAKTADGKFVITDRFGTSVSNTYSRRRDAVRGAARRGLTVN